MPNRPTTMLAGGGLDRPTNAPRPLTRSAIAGAYSVGRDGGGIFLAKLSASWAAMRAGSETPSKEAFAVSGGRDRLRRDLRLALLRSGRIEPYKQPYAAVRQDQARGRANRQG